AADDAAVLLFLAAVERELFLCGPVCCGIEAPPLPGRLVQELQSRRVLGEQLAGDERPLHRPGEGSSPDDVPQPERGEKLAGAYRRARGGAPIEVETFDREHTISPLDAVRVGEGDQILELGLGEERE